MVTCLKLEKENKRERLLFWAVYTNFYFQGHTHGNPSKWRQFWSFYEVVTTPFFIEIIDFWQCKVRTWDNRPWVNVLKVENKEVVMGWGNAKAFVDSRVTSVTIDTASIAAGLPPLMPAKYWIQIKLLAASRFLVENTDHSQNIHFMCTYRKPFNSVTEQDCV